MNSWRIVRVFLIVTFVSSLAFAQETAKNRAVAFAHELDRPYTMAEFGVGMLTLPTTDICLANPQTCTKGDISLDGFAWMLYRPNAHWAVGAGVTYAMPSNSGTPQQTEANLNRTHSRRYLLADVTARYYALHLDWLEGWFGATAGAVVVSDTYKSNIENPSAPILGVNGISVRTEGVSGGLAAGIGWSFAPNWSIEGQLRSAWWVLPSTRACAPTGDCATLANSVAMFSLGLAIGYRISL